MFEAFLATTVGQIGVRPGVAGWVVGKGLSRKSWKLGFACLAASTMVSASPVSVRGSDQLAPVTRIKRDSRFDRSSSLPPVIYRQPSSKVSSQTGITARTMVPESLNPATQTISEQAAGQTIDTEILHRVSEPPVLAPVIRGRPPKLQALDRARNPTPQMPAEPLPNNTKRSPVTRDRSVMRIPTVLSTENTRSSQLTSVPVQDSSYGDTKSLSEAVTIDLREPSQSATHQYSSVGQATPGRSEPALLSPTSLPPVDESNGDNAFVPSRVSALRQPPTPIKLDLDELSAEDDSAFSSSPIPSYASQHTRLPQCGSGTVIQSASAHLSPFHGQFQIARQPAPPASSPSDLAPPNANSEAPMPEGLPEAKSVEPVTGEELFRPIQQTRIDIAPGKGALPENRAATRFAKEGQQIQQTGYSRVDTETSFEWDAPAMCHRPLFFEDVNLERHGIHVKHHMQPLFSAAHFFARIPATPYLAVSQRSRVCNYTLGHYQPGSCAPYLWYYPRPSLAGVSVESAVVAGLILALP